MSNTAKNGQLSKTRKRVVVAMGNRVKEQDTSNQSIGVVPGRMTGPPVVREVGVLASSPTVHLP